VDIQSYTTGNGIAAQFIRSTEGALARVVYRHTAPVVQTARNGEAASTLALLGRTTQDTINGLLGVRSAHASEVAATAPLAATSQAASTLPASTLPGAILPGALGQPADPQALMDTR
jgi:hypothetical protein